MSVHGFVVSVRRDGTVMVSCPTHPIQAVYLTPPAARELAAQLLGAALAIEAIDSIYAANQPPPPARDL